MSRFRKPSLEGFPPYVPGFQPPDGAGWVKLNTNESPFPPSPAVLEAISQAATNLNRYPDPEQRALREAIATVFDILPEQAIAGNGADELLGMAMRAFVPRGGAVAYLAPSYSLVPALARIHDVGVEEHRWAEGWTLPESFIASDAPLKYVANPNSPTGTFLQPEAVAEAVGGGGVLLVDEAYVDFAPRSAVEALAQAPNILLLRTMSKSFSLAGLRLGFALGSTELVEDLWTVKDSYNVGRLPLAAAAAALADLGYRDACVEQVVANRARLTAEMISRGWDVLPSGANFIFAIPSRAVVDVEAGLRERKVLVRYFTTPGVDHGLRITVGTWDECQALLDALDD